MHLLLLICAALWGTGHSYPDFGMNKPHHLFHIGDRSLISVNVGWGYCTPDGAVRLKYQNKKGGLYADMRVHDGETMFEQVIQDQDTKLQSNIKYQLFENDHWETKISMQSQLNTLDPLSTDWFMYVTVENNDYRLVDHSEYSSYITLKPEYTDEPSKKSIQIKINSKIRETQTFSFDTSKQRMKIFGLTTNTSETYSIVGPAQVFHHLLQLSRGENVTRTTNQKLVEWEDNQVKQLKFDNFAGKKYVAVFIFGSFSDSEEVIVTNASSPSQFNEQRFLDKKQQLARQYRIKDVSERNQELIQHVVSNLYGGIALYCGRLYTQNSLIMHMQDLSYSFTPSRLIFPRAFLWDEGFHHSVAVHYKPRMVLDMLGNWMNKIDMFGWVGRQQIRGSQISSMLPDATFVFQDWFEMNPPTLMISLVTLLDKAQADQQLKQQVKKFIDANHHKMQLWYGYFKSTQSHETLNYNTLPGKPQKFFRWQCKDECKKGNFMGSGLDDYPRRINDSQIAKQHVDVVSWLYFFSNSLAKVGEYMQQNGIRSSKCPRMIAYYREQQNMYKRIMYEQFLDRQDYLFKDVVVDSKDVYLESFVDKVGYINLFPFFTGILSSEGSAQAFNNEQRIKCIRKTIEIMSSSELLFSEDGLRSLSISDELYGTDDNYWRGAVWMPINFLVLRACKLFYWEQQQIAQETQQFYHKLRQRLIETISRNYQETGYLYENYYEGKGHRGHPFYGWTALIANVIAEKY